MSPFRRHDGAAYYVDLRWRGLPRMKLTTGTTLKGRAIAIERTLYVLRDAGRRDIRGLLAAGRLRLAEHDAYSRSPADLEQLRARVESPAIGALVEEWLTWLRSPAGISPHTKRRYAVQSVRRYAASWEGFFTVLQQGREARLSDLTRGFVLDYLGTRQRAVSGKRRRRKTTGSPPSPATLNRDLAALGAFMSWLRDAKGFTVERLRLPRQREPSGRQRWLSSDELRAFERHCPATWWPFFAMLFYTGARVGEAQGLRGADVLLHARRITIHEGDRRVKSAQGVRDLPISASLERALGSHLARVRVGPSDLLFPGEAQVYWKVRRVWHSVLRTAEIAPATIHDARQTFGVHAAQAGVPIVRLQKLLGHATPVMTMRYMKHAPEAYIDQDGAAISAHMEGAADQETEARAAAARGGMQSA
jgi:integrase